MSPAENTRWIALGSFRDIPLRGARRVTVGERTIAVFRTADETLFAVEDRCPHKGGPLSQGIVHGDCVTCPLHNLVIGLDDGAARGVDQGRVARYSLKREGDTVMLAPDAPVADAVSAVPSGTPEAPNDARAATEPLAPDTRNAAA